MIMGRKHTLTILKCCVENIADDPVVTNTYISGEEETNLPCRRITGNLCKLQVFM